MIEYGNVREKLTLQPVSGKAIPMRRGEVLRIRQTLGEQCVDLNSFNMDDYKEYMDVSICRPFHGFRLKKNDIIFIEVYLFNTFFSKSCRNNIR